MSVAIEKPGFVREVVEGSRVQQRTGGGKAVDCKTQLKL
jgi:hypothetical protein